MPHARNYMVQCRQNEISVHSVLPSHTFTSLNTISVCAFMDSEQLDKISIDLLCRSHCSMKSTCDLCKNRLLRDKVLTHFYI